MQAWQAQLDLRFESRASSSAAFTTVLAHNQHTGPLRVQKALYPEPLDQSICHAIVVHPPAGIAAGDELNINIAVAESAHAVITTPGATQWYKSRPDSPARMTTMLKVATGGKLDYLPQENILFDHSHAQLHTTISLAHGASAIGWDMCALGRRAAGELWQHASLRQRFDLSLGGQTLWLEHSDLSSGSALRNNQLALAGHTVMATLWAVGADLRTDTVQAYAEHLPYTSTLKAGASYVQPPQADAATSGAMLLRVLGDSVESVRACMIDAWTYWRPVVHGVTAVPLRIWQT